MHYGNLKRHINLCLAFWPSIAGEVIGGCRDQSGGNNEALLAWQATLAREMEVGGEISPRKAEKEVSVRTVKIPIT